MNNVELLIMAGLEPKKAQDLVIHTTHLVNHYTSGDVEIFNHAIDALSRMIIKGRLDLMSIRSFCSIGFPAYLILKNHDKTTETIRPESIDEAISKGKISTSDFISAIFDWGEMPEEEVES